MIFFLFLFSLNILYSSLDNNLRMEEEIQKNELPRVNEINNYLKRIVSSVRLENVEVEVNRMIDLYKDILIEDENLEENIINFIKDEKKFYKEGEEKNVILQEEIDLLEKYINDLRSLKQSINEIKDKIHIFPDNIKLVILNKPHNLREFIREERLLLGAEQKKLLNKIILNIRTKDGEIYFFDYLKNRKKTLSDYLIKNKKYFSGEYLTGENLNSLIARKKFLINYKIEKFIKKINLLKKLKKDFELDDLRNEIIKKIQDGYIYNTDKDNEFQIYFKEEELKKYINKNFEVYYEKRVKNYFKENWKNGPKLEFGDNSEESSMEEKVKNLDSIIDLFYEEDIKELLKNKHSDHSFKGIFFSANSYEGTGSDEEYESSPEEYESSSDEYESSEYESSSEEHESSSEEHESSEEDTVFIN